MTDFRVTDEQKDKREMSMPSKHVEEKNIGRNRLTDLMEKEAVDAMDQMLNDGLKLKEICQQLKKLFNLRHGQHWHCIVGKNFAR